MTNETDACTFHCYCGGIFRLFNEKYWCSRCNKMIDFSDSNVHPKTTDKIEQTGTPWRSGK